MTAQEYKSYKGIRKENLRDNMTDLEVAITNIGELAEIKPERREVIEKVIIEGLSYREAAKECNCSHDAIMRKLDKGIFNIRMNFPVAYYRHFNSDS